MGDAAAVPAPSGERSILQILFGLYTDPGESFADIVKRPRFWIPLVIMVSLSVGFTAVWLQKVDAAEFVKTMLEESGRWDQIPADRRAEILESAAGSFSVRAWPGAVLGAPVVILIVAAVMLFVFRFFYSGEVTFAQAMGVVAWTYMAVGLVQTPLMLLVMFMKGDWNVNPREVLQANLTLLVSKESVGKALYTLLGCLDLFSSWILGLLTLGFSRAIKCPFASALWGVAIPWAVYAGGKVGLTALLGF